MNSRMLRRCTGAFALAALLAAPCSAALAQENLGSAVTVGGGVSGVGGGEVVVIAPGVTISGGNVSNSTGIGVNAGGGSSIGATTGGSDSAAVVE